MRSSLIVVLIIAAMLVAACAQPAPAPTSVRAHTSGCCT